MENFTVQSSLPPEKAELWDPAVQCSDPCVIKCYCFYISS